ncbi:MAG: hypothetical protein GXY45_11720 [Ramlibacter sp.]|nr:hypothetical protein [Ramlibacter sp.]
MSRDIDRSVIDHYVRSFRYGDNATGEDGLLNCWGLLRHVQQHYFGIDLPATSLGDDMARLYEQRMQSGRWLIVPRPFHGAGVLLRDGQEPHCGVWLDVDGGGVLHCERGVGVRWQKPLDLRMAGYGRLKYYRFDNEPSGTDH